MHLPPSPLAAELYDLLKRYRAAELALQAAKQCVVRLHAKCARLTKELWVISRMEEKLQRECGDARKVELTLKYTQAQMRVETLEQLRTCLEVCI